MPSLPSSPARLTNGRSATKYRLGASPAWHGKSLASLPLNKPFKPGARTHEKFVELRSLLLARRRTRARPGCRLSPRV